MNDKSTKRIRRLADHIDVVGIREVPALGIVEVKVTFDTSPDKEYTFEIDEEDFQSDKLHIVEEIDKQLRA